MKKTTIAAIILMASLAPNSATAAPTRTQVCELINTGLVYTPVGRIIRNFISTRLGCFSILP